MSSFTAREVRAWAVANDIPCPTTGKLPRRVIDAYLLDVHGVTTDPDDDTAPAVEPQAADGEPVFTVTVEITGHDDASEEISQHLVNALWSAYQAGRVAERRDMITQLGGAA